MFTFFSLNFYKKLESQLDLEKSDLAYGVNLNNSDQVLCY